MDIETALRTLGVSSGCTPEDLKAAYRKKARETHPDRAGTGSEQLFIGVKRAYDFLLLSGTRVKAKRALTHKSIFSIVVK